MPFLSRKKANPAPTTTVGAPIPIAAPSHSHSTSTSSSASSRPGTGHSGTSNHGANQFGAKAPYGYPVPQQQQSHGHSASSGSAHSYSNSYGSAQNGGGGYQNGGGGGGGHQSHPSHSSQHSAHSSHSAGPGQGQGDHPPPPVRKHSHHSSRGPSHGSSSSFAAQHNYPMPPQPSQHQQQPSGQYVQGSSPVYQQQQPAQNYGGQPAYPSNSSYHQQQQQQPYQGQTPRPPQGISGQPSFSSDASSVTSNVLYDDRADRSSSAATSVSRGTTPLSKQPSKPNMGGGGRQQGGEEEHEEDEDEDIEMDSRRAHSMAAAGAALSHKHAGTGPAPPQPTPSGSVVPLPVSDAAPSSATPGGTASRIANLSIKSPTPSQTSSMIMRKTASRYTLSDFNIIRTLGTGSFGRVHLVRSNHNSRFYAVKVLSKERVVKMKQVEHTNSEREMLERVRHPFLVNLWGTFKDSTNLYMVMDFVAGGELFSLLRKSQRFPDPVAKFFAAEVALALDYLHSLDIIYRDLKPENILLAADGHVKITDFGFAKYVPDITWTLCGTPDYLAPEIVQSRGYNKSVDWYALGVLMFEMLAGYPPFLVQDSNPMKLYEKIIAGKIRYPSYFSPPAKELLKSLLTSDLTKRFGNLANGSQDIFTHQWFAEVDWAKLYAKQIPAPYVPRVEGEGDASCFDKYEEPDLSEYGKSGEDPYGHLFSCF